MFTDAEKAVAAKVLQALARPEKQDDDADFPIWSHNGWDLDESELRCMRGVLRSFAEQHEIVANLPDPDDQD